MPTEGRLGFLSKSSRGVPVYSNSPVGPGEYAHPTDHDNRPNFAPFCTTTSNILPPASICLKFLSVEREMAPMNSYTPSPGAYDIAQTYEVSCNIVHMFVFTHIWRIEPD
jgi:hypothetical protein